MDPVQNNTSTTGQFDKRLASEEDDAPLFNFDNLGMVLSKQQ